MVKRLCEVYGAFVCEVIHPLLSAKLHALVVG